jgi:hypothetical protein
MVGFAVERETTDKEVQSLRLQVLSGSNIVIDHVAEIAFNSFVSCQALVRVDNVLLREPGNLEIRLLQDTSQLGTYTCKVVAGPPVGIPQVGKTG